MSEFSTAGETPISAPRLPPAAKDRLSWLNRPLLLGLSLPWLIGFGLIVGGAGWYLFAPERSSSVNELAFNEANVLQPVTGEILAPASAGNSIEMSQVQQDVAAMVGGVRSYAEANRMAIERLVQNGKTQTAQFAEMKQQLVELQAQNSVLSARVSALETKPGGAPKRVKPSASVATSSPLAGMRLSAVQYGMAWVYWQEQTWAVQVGDRLGPITVTGIDANSRQVHTSAGTLK